MNRNIAWARQDEGYVSLCQQIAARAGGFTRQGQPIALSAQNRRVRITADLTLAGTRTFYNWGSRQQDRAASR